METLTNTTHRLKNIATERCTSAENCGINVSDNERLASGVAGGLFALLGLRRKSLFGLALAAVGGGLLYRGITGHCSLYSKLGMSTHDNAQTKRTIHLESSIVVNKPLHEIYSFWRKLENLPRFAPELKSMTTLGDKISHGTVETSGGGSLEWAAKIINDVPDRVIAWQSLPDADVYTAGSVCFRKRDQGTEVRVVMNYLPPLGKFGHAVVQALGKSPLQQIEADLRRFKEIIECGDDASKNA